MYELKLKREDTHRDGSAFLCPFARFPVSEPPLPMSLTISGVAGQSFSRCNRLLEVTPTYQENLEFGEDFGSALQDVEASPALPFSYA